MRRLFLLQAIGLLCNLGRAAPSAEAEVTPRGLEKRAPTCNTPSNRACWSDGFDINTDYEVKIPETGVTRSVRKPLWISLVELGLTRASMIGLSAKPTTGSAAMDFPRTLPCSLTVSVFPSDFEIEDIS